MNDLSEKLLLSVDDAAELCTLGRTTMWALVRERAIPIVRVGRAVRIPRQALLAWIASQTEASVTD